MVLPSLPVLTIFCTQVLVIALFGLTVAGHFPIAHRKPELKNALGSALIGVTMFVVAVAAANTVGMAVARLPTYAGIIGAGASLLAAPLALARLPPGFVDGRNGLLTLATLAAVLALIATRLT